mmetsp:Transcript_56004/g.119085  ORF Transcript_56004/g.119085 Transcript_56004/m.119085 type:complete len:214 (+) Transcript_56004:258-899(+)
MMFASGSSTLSVMYSAARSTSYNVMSDPPVMFTSIPLADPTSMLPSPRRGLFSAILAARTARHPSSPSFLSADRPSSPSAARRASSFPPAASPTPRLPTSSSWHACPVPRRALPMPCMTLCTSAKSRLISPGLVMRSVMLLTPASRTSSARRNESTNDVFSPTSRNRFWLGTTISVSDTSFSRSTPSSARRRRWVPSKRKGVVTTETVRMPRS